MSYADFERILSDLFREYDENGLLVEKITEKLKLFCEHLHMTPHSISSRFSWRNVEPTFFGTFDPVDLYARVSFLFDRDIQQVKQYLAKAFAHLQMHALRSIFAYDTTFLLVVALHEAVLCRVEAVFTEDLIEEAFMELDGQLVSFFVFGCAAVQFVGGACTRSVQRLELLVSKVFDNVEGARHDFEGLSDSLFKPKLSSYPAHPHLGTNIFVRYPVEMYPLAHWTDNMLMLMEFHFLTGDASHFLALFSPQSFDLIRTAPSERDLQYAIKIFVDFFERKKKHEKSKGEKRWMEMYRVIGESRMISLMPWVLVFAVRHYGLRFQINLDESRRGAQYISSLFDFVDRIKDKTPMPTSPPNLDENTPESAFYFI